jgi:hypothetical protein
MISVLVDHGTSIIYSETATAAVSAPLGFWLVRFSPDTESIATAGRDSRIKVCA